MARAKGKSPTDELSRVFRAQRAELRKRKNADERDELECVDAWLSVKPPIQPEHLRDERYKPDPDKKFEELRQRRYRLICARFGRKGLTVDEYAELKEIDEAIASYLESKAEDDAATIRTAARYGWSTENTAAELRDDAEEYTEWPLDWLPSSKAPGSAEKIEVMQRRVEREIAPNHPRDSRFIAADTNVTCADRRMNGRDVDRHSLTLAEWIVLEAEIEAEEAADDLTSFDNVARRYLRKEENICRTKRA